jgi:glycosyltransferase involved in cell wall biosynthesis
LSPDHTFRVVYAGRLDAIKGLNLGIKSFRLFVDKYPNSRFTIIGIGPEQTRLEALVRTLNLDDRVIFSPWLDRADLFEMLRSSDVLLFPSFRDGGGQIVIEAMAQGKPVIGINVGGPGFHIKAEWGIKIEPESPEFVIRQMSDALEKLCVDENLRTELGKAAKRRAEEYYLWERLGERLQRIYEKVIPGYQSLLRD